jgi:ABC-type glycerol-3-phosphate transport system substrate-binding protein
MLILVIITGAAFGGGNRQGSVSGNTGSAIKVLFKGPKADGYDDVYQEYLRRTRDSLNIQVNMTFIEHADYRDKLNLEILSGSDWDLVFEAPWVLLRTLAMEGYYADLRQYFNNDRYPGLKKAFSMEVMESNVWNNRMCYIPLYRAYGSGVSAVHYRQDWADQWGIGRIDSYAKLEQYWQAAKDRGILPLAVTAARGFFQLEPVKHPGINVRDTALAGVMGVNAGSASFRAYIRNGRLAALAPNGAGDAAFRDFPAPWNRDYAIDRLEVFAGWNQKGFISPDSLTLTDANTPFWAGQAASVIGTLDDVENNARNFPRYSPEAVIGEFIYLDDVRNLVPGSISASLAANNGLAVPENSRRKDDVMRFLDWLFASQENHDLFELGIQGKDYALNSDGTYRPISVYPANWPGYGFTWNPNYVTYSEFFTGDLKKYRDYERSESSITLPPMTGFSFDGTDINMATYVAQVRAVSDKIARTQLHGILSDGNRSFRTAREMMDTNLAEMNAAGLQNIQNELARQIQAYLDSGRR